MHHEGNMLKAIVARTIDYKFTVNSSYGSS